MSYFPTEVDRVYIIQCKIDIATRVEWKALLNILGAYRSRLQKLDISTNYSYIIDGLLIGLRVLQEDNPSGHEFCTILPASSRYGTLIWNRLTHLSIGLVTIPMFASVLIHCTQLVTCEVTFVNYLCCHTRDASRIYQIRTRPFSGNSTQTIWKCGQFIRTPLHANVEEPCTWTSEPMATAEYSKACNEIKLCHRIIRFQNGRTVRRRSCTIDEEYAEPRSQSQHSTLSDWKTQLLN